MSSDFKYLFKKYFYLLLIVSVIFGQILKKGKKWRLLTDI